MNSQSELFEELVGTINPQRQFAEFRAGKKIIQIPYSIWKDGRIRADGSRYGAGVVVSRSEKNLQERVIRALHESLGTIVEVVRHEFAQFNKKNSQRPRVSNKLARIETPGPRRYINPFVKDIWSFSKAPHWLMARREPSPAEKLVYARLTYAPREKEEERICKKDISSGAILELNQSRLASELGIRRECVCTALKSLQKRGLIHYIGNQGAKGCIRFLWHPWMPKTCALNAHVTPDAHVRSDNSTCVQNEQVDRQSCAQNKQVSPGTEKRDLREKDGRTTKPLRRTSYVEGKW